jgi:hypothetical protein
MMLLKGGIVDSERLVSEDRCGELIIGYRI